MMGIMGIGDIEVLSVLRTTRTGIIVRHTCTSTVSNTISLASNFSPNLLFPYAYVYCVQSKE